MFPACYHVLCNFKAHLKASDQKYTARIVNYK